MLLPTWSTVPPTSVHLAQPGRSECLHQVWLTFAAALPFPVRKAGEHEGQRPESDPGSSDWAPGLSESAAQHGPYQSRREEWKAEAVVHTLPACVS